MLHHLDIQFEATDDIEIAKVAISLDGTQVGELERFQGLSQSSPNVYV